VGVVELKLTCPRLVLPSLADTQYKPDGAVQGDGASNDVKGDSSSTAGIDRTTNMRLAEARLILNVKEDTPMEKIKAVSSTADFDNVKQLSLS
jgi:hypothetical protein